MNIAKMVEKQFSTFFLPKLKKKNHPLPVINKCPVDCNNGAAKKKKNIWHITQTLGGGRSIHSRQ